MTKSELIEKLYTNAGSLTQEDVRLSVDTILNAMTEQLGMHDRIEIRGFGSFSVNYRAARLGRNPKTGEKVAVPAKAAPHFKAGVELRERVQEKPVPQKLAA